MESGDAGKEKKKKSAPWREPADSLFAQLLHRRISSWSCRRRLRQEALLDELLLIPAHRHFGVSHDANENVCTRNLLPPNTSNQVSYHAGTYITPLALVHFYRRSTTSRTPHGSELSSERKVGFFSVSTVVYCTVRTVLSLPSFRLWSVSSAHSTHNTLKSTTCHRTYKLHTHPRAVRWWRRPG